MAVIKRQAETDRDMSITVGDLINQCLKLNSSNSFSKSKEESTYQWNNFVKDFCKDPDSKLFSNKLKVAAVLWQHVKTSDQPKLYRHALITEHENEIKEFKLQGL